MINFALIGSGKFGKNYIRLLKEIKGVNLKIIINKGTDLNKVLNDPTIQCVIIATPSSTHYSITKAVIKSNKNLLIEKPMVLNLKEAKDLQNLSKKYKKTYMVGFQYIYNDYIKYIKNNFKIIDEIKWEHYLSPKREDVDCFFDVAPHALSVFQFLFNPIKIEHIEKKIDGIKKNSKDSVYVTIRFDRGPLLTISASWQGTKKVRKVSFKGEKVKIILDETKINNKLIIKTGTHQKNTKTFKSEPLKNELNQFIHSIKNNKKPITNIEFGYMNTKFLEEISNYINKN